jgi:hypothetical protein
LKDGEPIFDEYGCEYYAHSIKFPEEVPYLADLKISDKDSPEVVSSSQPINIQNFVKFIREKYRLCWKEIYLKFAAINFLAEKCIKCRRWFQISHIAGCDDGFHTLDFNEVELPGRNGFSNDHFQIYIRQY